MPTRPLRRIEVGGSTPTLPALPVQRYGDIRGNNVVLTRIQGQKLIFSGRGDCEIKLAVEAPTHVWLMVTAPGQRIRKENEPLDAGQMNTRYVKVDIARQLDRHVYEDKPGIVVGENFLVRVQKKSGFGGKRFFMILPPDIKVKRPERGSNPPTG